MRNTAIFPTLRAGAAAFALVLAACESSSGIIVGGPGSRTVQSVVVTPDGGSVQAGSTLQFQASAILTDGDTTTATVDWTATGGTITSGGLFTAGPAAGAFRVVARTTSGVADTASVTVTVPSANPTLAAVVVTPATATVGAGGTLQFAASGRLSNGATQAVSVTWTATGGIVNGTGSYTAGGLPGSYQVVATGPGGLADTAAVTITGAGQP